MGNKKRIYHKIPVKVMLEANHASAMVKFPLDFGKIQVYDNFNQQNGGGHD
ncbi:MAG: hypothetical protein RRY25_07810 [Anaerovorax sp.]